MSKLGLRLGWTPPPRFQFSDDFAENLGTKTSRRFSPGSIEKLEAACYRLMVTRRKSIYEAEGVPTRKILKGWASLYAKLDDALREPLPRGRCKHSPDRGWEPEIAAAWMAVAKCSDSQTAMKLPDDLNRHMAEIEAMRYLTDRAYREVAVSISSGPEGNEPVKFWIADVADVFESEGVSVTTKTRRGPKTSPKFTAVLELLRREMSPAEYERVRLPSAKQLVELSREVLTSRLDAPGKKKTKPEKSRQPR